MSDASNITEETIVGLAKLARLALTDEEIKNGTEQLKHALDHFAMIQDIAVSEGGLVQSISGLQNISRSDEAKPDHLCNTDTVLKNAPQVQNSQVKVKAVFS